MGFLTSEPAMKWPWVWAVLLLSFSVALALASDVETSEVEEVGPDASAVNAASWTQMLARKKISPKKKSTKKASKKASKKKNKKRSKKRSKTKKLFRKNYWKNLRRRLRGIHSRKKLFVAKSQTKKMWDNLRGWTGGVRWGRDGMNRKGASELDWAQDVDS